MMKKTTKWIAVLLASVLLLSGCAKRSYDTSDQLVLGISENLRCTAQTVLVKNIP